MRRMGGFLAAALMCGLSFGVPAQGMKALPTATTVMADKKLRRLGFDFDSPNRYRERLRKGPGWTERQVKRAARKRRNVAQHRARSKKRGH